MIAVDLQPFSIVENIGFQRLLHHLYPSYPIPSRKFMKENIIQGIYASVKGSIYQDVLLEKYLSLTSDGWTSSNKCSFLSLTAHWIDGEFDQKDAILSVTPFNQKHTVFHVSECLQNAMEAYRIPASKVHVIVRDNAANMVAGVTQAGYQSLSCFIHTLQLVLKDAIFEQRYVNDIITTCRSIVGHFNRSPLALLAIKSTDLNFSCHDMYLFKMLKPGGTVHILCFTEFWNKKQLL